MKNSAVRIKCTEATQSTRRVQNTATKACVTHKIRVCESVAAHHDSRAQLEHDTLQNHKRKPI